MAQNNKLDVHFYDGKLNDVKINDYKADPKRSGGNGNFNILKDLINHWVPENIKNNAIAAIDIINRDVGSQANFDASNGKYAEDVLLSICDLLKINQADSMDGKEGDLKGIIFVLSEQLADIIVGGQCPQGRSTRLIQVMLSLK